MADSRRKTRRAITLALGRSKMGSSEEHSHPQEVAWKDNVDVYCPVTPWDLAEWTPGPSTCPMNYLFPPPLPRVRCRGGCYVVGGFLVCLSREPFIYG